MLSTGSNGTYSRTGIPPGDYTLRVVARDPVRGDRKVIRNRLWVHSDDANDPYCITYLINRGWRVEGRNFTVEFTATGIASGFVCTLDRMERIDCKILLTLDAHAPEGYCSCPVCVCLSVCPSAGANLETGTSIHLSEGTSSLSSTFFTKIQRCFLLCYKVRSVIKLPRTKPA